MELEEIVITEEEEDASCDQCWTWFEEGDIAFYNRYEELIFCSVDCAEFYEEERKKE